MNDTVTVVIQVNMDLADYTLGASDVDGLLEEVDAQTMVMSVAMDILEKQGKHGLAQSLFEYLDDLTDQQIADESSKLFSGSL
jgi:hypothetical protein